MGHKSKEEMREPLRKIYNAVDILFDRQAITEELRSTHEVRGANQPTTAGQAFQLIRPFVRQVDRQARLKSIISQQGLNPDGSSTHWEFFFDLPQRRAHLVSEWILSWDELIDAYGPAKITIFANPFPPPGSPLRQLVKEGKLLHQQLIGLWKQECKRVTYLPEKFRNTDAVTEDLSRQGLDLTLIEFALSTGHSPDGRLSWIAQTRSKKYFVPFDN
jgi:hypothetical protein